MLDFSFLGSVMLSDNVVGTPPLERCNSPLPPALAQALLVKAVNLYDAGNFEGAAIQFRNLGNVSRPLYNVAICYLRLGDESSAVLK